jgi:RNA polymerase sigma-70 factor (ECF subfamily)
LTSLLQALNGRVTAELALELGGLVGKLDALVARAEASDSPPADVEAWAAHLARHLVPGRAKEQLDEMHAADVQLALGCLAGNVVSLAEFEVRVRAVTPRALGKMPLCDLSIDDVLQDVRERLLIRAGGALPKLATYGGRGPLDGWLRVTIARAAVGALRARDPEAVRREDDAVIEAAADDPELAALKRKFAPALSRAVHDAVASLPDAERALLRMHLVDGLGIDDLAVIHRAHRATMARRLARVRSMVFEGIKERARAELGIREDELKSLMAVVLSQIDVTIRGAIDGR